MPDSPYLKTIVDSLIVRNDKILKYVEEQQKMPQGHLNLYGVVLFVLFVLMFLAAVLPLFKKRSFVEKYFIKSESEEDTGRFEKRRNYKWVAYWLIASSILFAALMEFGLIHNSKRFAFSESDLLLAAASIIAIVGAVWAVFARVDAERAFKQSKKTYEALGTMFDFATFFEKDKLQKIYEEIGTKDSNISLYLGFPIVGLPFERRNELDIKPEELFLKLKEKLEHYKNKLGFPKPTPFDFSLYIGYVDKAEGCRILDDILSNEPELKNVLSTHLNDFYNIVDFFYPKDLANGKRKNISEKIRFVELELKEKFRYITIKKIEDDTSNKKTYVWVVDFKEDKNNNFKPFDSKIFQTQDERFLGLLENIFK